MKGCAYRIKKNHALVYFHVNCTYHNYLHVLSLIFEFYEITDCQKTVSKPSITDSLCNIKSDCTSSECCTEIDFLKRSFHTYLDIDPCNFVLKVGIEKFNREISIAEYQWGEWQIL